MCIPFALKIGGGCWRNYNVRILEQAIKPSDAKTGGLFRLVDFGVKDLVKDNDTSTTSNTLTTTTCLCSICFAYFVSWIRQHDRYLKL